MIIVNVFVFIKQFLHFSSIIRSIGILILKPLIRYNILILHYRGIINECLQSF